MTETDLPLRVLQVFIPQFIIFRVVTMNRMVEDPQSSEKPDLQADGSEAVQASDQPGPPDESALSHT